MLIQRTHNQRCAGLTLIEMLVTLAIFMVAIVAISSAVVYFYRTNATTVSQIYSIESARKGAELMVRDIREMAYGDDGAFPLETIETNGMMLYSDVDRDTSVERVRYRLNGLTLERGITNAVSGTYNDANEHFFIVSENVRNVSETVSLFTYYDSSGTEITDLNDVTSVAYVAINLIVNYNPERSSNITLRSSASPRNLKTNL